MIRILCIDIGILNPSIVILHLYKDNSLKISEYILNISTTNNIYINLIPLTKKKIDYVLIEKQTPKNIQCYKISFMLEMFFKCVCNINVYFLDPISKNNKLKNRKERKQYSINLAIKRLEKMDLKWKNMTHDFADALNLGLNKLSEINKNKKKIIQINKILDDFIKNVDTHKQ